jgi:hypothetical protein
MAGRVIQGFFVTGPPRNSVQLDARELGLEGRTGQPLPEAVRRRMEAALGADFSRVRVHVGPEAPRIGAAAFTMSTDIYFAPGSFQPNTIPGQQLLARQLAHVVQQRQGRAVNPAGSGIAVVRDRLLETEAERLSHRAVAWQPHAPRTIQRARAPLNPNAAPFVPRVLQAPPQPALGPAPQQPAQQQPPANQPAPQVPAPPQPPQIPAGPAPQPPPPARRGRFRGRRLVLGVPDVGGYLNTLATPNHAVFADIVIFSLNNNPGFNEIHVHRNALRVAVQISKKQTGDQGNGTAVAAGSALFIAAAAAAANH